METFGEAKAEWLQQFLGLPCGIPSHDTFGCVLSVIAPAEFERCLLKWVKTQVKLTDGEVVALDGKTLRGSHDPAQGAGSDRDRQRLGGFRALDARGRQSEPTGSNEITAVPEVLRRLNIAGCIVTVDALNSQKAIAAQIREQQADYVLGLERQSQKLARGGRGISDCGARRPDLGL